MIIRLATCGDVDSLFELNELFNGAGCTTKEMMERAIIENNREDVFVAIVNDVCIGFCCVQITASMCYSLRTLEVTELFVLNEYRRQGAAKAMLRYLEEFYSDKGINNCYILTGDDNDIAHALYENLGYELIDEVCYEKRFR